MSRPDMKLPTVLMIDDEPQFLRLMERALREEFTVLAAEDALDGYALLCQHKPDIVLLDVMMPMLDGWTVLRKIRSSRAFSKVRVLVVTGLGPEAARHEASLLGVTKILHKPLAPSQLVTAVREALAEPQRKPDQCQLFGCPPCGAAERPLEIVRGHQRPR